jgi:hypothetical protein
MTTIDMTDEANQDSSLIARDAVTHRVMHIGPSPYPSVSAGNHMIRAAGSIAPFQSSMGLHFAVVGNETCPRFVLRRNLLLHCEAVNVLYYKRAHTLFWIEQSCSFQLHLFFDFAFLVILYIYSTSIKLFNNVLSLSCVWLG